MDLYFLKTLIEYGVLGVLGIMGFISCWLWIERLIFYRRVDIKRYKHIGSLEIDLTNNINIIATCASNSPYIGLFGTVLGIILTFSIMGQTDTMDVKNIMNSLALALKATAMGLFVAIPSLIFYNHLIRKIEIILTNWETANETHENQ